MYLPHPTAAPQLLQRVHGNVRGCQLLGRAQQQPGTVQGHIANAAHCYCLHSAEVHWQLPPIWVGIVPPHKLAGSEHTMAVLYT